ncbi:uncharacterized protein K444DRAFT_661259 [Hyaloscypha bicolor E]|uniref:Uncharacterized protein n=1 Tax=Hyaloscypha bicolor E TaxID=1095630 RepID=A0A2J6TJM4_9HELO|nr:uncharacterized protein K444DRAFT_661259 [Hyaloscypha bicolor E]PMD63214.1 hypothetical protein K444DRAFT_661259 [Hyaloscypha bicolor E]
MGTASKVVSVVFRIGELTCACIVLGILGRFLYLLDLGNGHADSKIIYAEVIAGISVAASIILLPPFLYSFWAFPLDCALFICWMVAFGLLDNLSGAHTCSSYWYTNYWGYYWGRLWYHPYPIYTPVGNVGCGPWRTVLAFSFIGGLCWLVNSFIGLYVVFTKRDDRKHLNEKSGTRMDDIHRETGQTQAQTPADTGAVA